jgi:hypothetical protein
MLVGLLLQFSVLQFCFFTFQDREGKRKTNKQTKIKKNSFTVGRPTAAANPSTRASPTIMYLL